VRIRLPSARPGRRALALGALGAVAAGATLAVVTTGGEGEPAGAQDPGAPTVELERRDLVARESVDGTLGYSGEADVINRLSGTITWLPATGDVIHRGGRLFEVDGEPVALMYGDVPAYRELAAGVSDGPDVEQLESNLDALGFDAGGSLTVDDEFTSATTDAVAEWQEERGLEETGTVELGRVVFMAGARRVTSLALSLGADAGSGAAGGTDVAAPADTRETTLASYVAAEPTTGPEDENEDKSPANDDEGNHKPKKKQKPGGTGDPAQEPQASQDPPAAAAQTPQEEADPSAEESQGGSSPSTEVMTTTSERRAVTVELDPADSELAGRGSRAVVSLPDGEEVKGRVSSVGTVAESEESATGEETDPTIEVTISLPDGERVTGLDQAPVTVELTDEVRKDVFAVPVESLLGTAGDGYAIVLRAGGDDAGERRQIPVEPGLFADGYVEVEGEELREGSLVEVPGE
jgi:peptidoglycan hydrolase-like protein with peptidoglycan-binding domain